MLSKMCNNCYLLLVTLFAAVLLVGSETPSFITKCKAEDSDCAKTSAQSAIPIIASGLPDYGIETLDPLFFKTLDASSNSLKLVFTDVTVKGLNACKANKIQRNADNTKFTVKVTCDVDFDGQYEINGQLLIVPIQGKGAAHIKLRKITINNILDVGTMVDKDGQKHWDIKTWKHTYTLKDKASVVLENLFPGNEVLGRVARELVSNSGNEIVVEVGPPIVKQITTKIIESVNTFFHKVPSDDLTLE